MELEYDPAKDAANLKKHRLALDAFATLDFERGLFTEDRRHIYSETRTRVIAPMQGRLCVAVFTMRGAFFRVISLRKANQRERRYYEKNQN